MDCNGITVISGLNSTGKSTILKAVYSVLSPAAEYDSIKMDQIRTTLLSLFLRYGREDIEHPYKVRDLDEEVIEALINELEGRIGKDNEQDLRAFDYLKKIYSGELEEEFLSRVVESKIRSEFEDIEQFRSMDSKKMSRVRITSGISADCKVYRDGKVVFQGNRRRIPWTVYCDSPFNVDNPMSHYLPVNDHRADVRRLLEKPRDQDLIMEAAFDSNIRRFDEAVEKAIPGEFVNTKAGLRFRDAGGRVFSVRNIAAGAKVFGMIRMLVDKGYIREGSVLLLDEPEVHLHPQWINILADAIVILARDIRVRVMMTTHSPQLMMAIESKTRSCREMTSFYHLSRDGDGNIGIDDATGHLEKVYDEMAEPIQSIASTFWE